MSFQIGRDELAELLADEMPQIHVPAEKRPADAPEIERFVITFTNKDRHQVDVVYSSAGIESAELVGFRFPPSKIDEGQPTMVFGIDRETKTPVYQNVGSAQRRSLFPLKLAALLGDRIYTFNAERYNIGRSKIKRSTNLDPDASNLASVLHALQTNEPANWNRLNRMISRIFPDISHITTNLVEDDEVEVRVSSVDADDNRPDLSQPLAQCGTGIGQVISLLTVVVASFYPRIILIDEPQTFLHPGALRKLIDVLRFEGLQRHQFIVTTHSPAVISASDPATVLSVRKDGPESQIQTIDLREEQHLRDCLAEVGARPSDVFGSDRILWLEGPTEEACFPKILASIANRRSPGTTMVAVRATGDLEGRFAEKYLDIYQRLSEGGGLQPPALAFIFDKENRSQVERQTLEKRLGGKVHFLPVRMFENYLVNPEAIAFVISSIDSFFTAEEEESPIEKVQSWLEVNRWADRFFKEPILESERSDELWRREANGVALLADLFSELSDCRVNYEKLAYGELLTGWLIANSPDDLQEPASLLERVIAAG